MQALRRTGTARALQSQAELMSGLKLWVRRRDGANTELAARRREIGTHKALLFVPWRWVRCAIFTPMN